MLSEKLLFDLEAGEPVGFVTAGGAVKGALVGAMLWPFLVEYFDRISWIVSISASTWNAQFAKSGLKTAIAGMSIYPNVCVTKDFFNFWRFNNVLNLDLIKRSVSRLIAPGEHLLLREKPRLYMAVTDAETGEGHLVDAAEASPDVRTLAAASSNILFPTCARPIIANGISGADGGYFFSTPVLAEQAVCQVNSRHPVKHIIVITYEKDWLHHQLSPVERVVLETGCLRFPQLRKLIANDAYRRRQSACNLTPYLGGRREPFMHFLAVPAHAQYGRFERNHGIVRRCMSECSDFAYRQMGKEPIPFVLPY